MICSKFESYVYSHAHTAFSRKLNFRVGFSVKESSIRRSSTISDQSVGDLALLHCWKALRMIVYKNNYLEPKRGFIEFPRRLFLRHALYDSTTVFLVWQKIR